MAINDEPAPLATDGSDYAAVTGEFPVIPANPSAEWVIHFETCQHFCQRGKLCYEGARLLAKMAGGQG